MIKLIAALGLSVVAAVAMAATPAEQVYRCLDARDAGYYYISADEYGDAMTLGGTSRTVNSITVQYTATLANVAGSTATVRLYSMDTNTGLPLNLLWTSAAQPLANGEHLLNVVVPGVSATNDVCVTVQFAGMAQTSSDFAALTILGSNANGGPFGPAIGTSADYFVDYNGGWGAYYFGGQPVANFGMAICCNDVPAAVNDNTVNYGAYYFPSADELGDVAELEGPNRIGTSLTVGCYATGLDGNTDTSKYGVLKLYTQDANGMPLTNYFTSPNITINASGGLALFTASLPYLALPDTVLWTVQFFGIDQSAQTCGVLFMQPEKSGFSGDWFPLNPGGGGWGAYWFGGGASSTANFFARVDADGAFVNNVALIEGLPVLGNTLAKLQHVDNAVYKIIRPRLAYLDKHSQITLITKAVATNKSVKEIDVDITSLTNNFTGGANDVNTYRVDLLDVTTNTYVNAGTGSWTAANTFATSKFAVTTNASNYVNQTTGLITARVVFYRKQVGFTIPANWTVSVDQLAFQAIPSDQTAAKVLGSVAAMHPSNLAQKPNVTLKAIEAKRLR